MLGSKGFRMTCPDNDEFSFIGMPSPKEGLGVQRARIMSIADDHYSLNGGEDRQRKLSDDSEWFVCIDKPINKNIVSTDMGDAMIIEYCES